MIRRAAICEALLPGLRQEDVRWELEVLRVDVQDEGAGVIVEFANGTTETMDLVIGADGMRSKVKDVVQRTASRCIRVSLCYPFSSRLPK